MSTLKYVAIICLLVLGNFQAIGADRKYPITEIPPSLLTNTTVVVREYAVDLEVKSIDRMITKYHVVYTILNEHGDEFNTVAVHYDMHSKILNLEGYQYDAFGNQVQKLKKSEITDQSAIPNGTIYGDSRIRVATLDSPSYPYTVEFEYEVSSSTTMFYPTWSPVIYDKMSLQHGQLRATSPDDLPIRYKEQLIGNPVQKSTEDAKTTLFWELENLESSRYEEYSPGFSQYQPKIYLAPGKFSIDGVEGNMETWASLGDWVNKLNQGRDDLPQSVIDEIKNLTEGLPTKEKIKKVYQYLQNNTRYVSVQLGIGGYQPFNASFVKENGYGDCKALTNYTKAMLESIGIPSIYTLVKAGSYNQYLRTDFPSLQFNHAFLCVPLSQDTIWLECTSQTNPFGYLGKFTGDRDVLLITDQGGKIAHTPAKDANDNKQITVAEVQVDISGDAEAKVNIDYMGIQYENNDLDYYINQSPDNQKKWLYKHLDVNGVTINSYDLKKEGDIDPIGTKTLNLSVKNYATVNGKRIFIQPNMLNKIDSYPSSDDERENDIKIWYSNYDIDTITFYLPQGYHIEFKPNNEEIVNEFGEYHTEYQIDGNKITYIRRQIFHKGIYDKSKYDEFRNFLKSISRKDKVKVVLAGST